MLHRPLGKTGVSVSAIGFGSWNIGGQWGAVDHATAYHTIRAAFDEGVNFFDTADAYGEPPGLSEERLGDAIKEVRDRIVLATKVGNFGRRNGHPLLYTSPLHVELCCDASLHRLKTDVIDLYQCHIGDLADPGIFHEAFDALIKKGKIRFGGISTHSLEVVKSFNAGGRCAAVQLDYSLLNLTPERELLPFCQDNQIGVIVRGPLAMGVASGKFTARTQFTDSVRSGWNTGAAREKYLERLSRIDKLRFLETPSRPLAAAALQFVISHPAVSTAIPGAKNPDQARLNAAAGNAVLTDDELKRVREIV